MELHQLDHTSSVLCWLALLARRWDMLQIGARRLGMEQLLFDTVASHTPEVWKSETHRAEMEELGLLHVGSLTYSCHLCPELDFALLRDQTVVEVSRRNAESQWMAVCQPLLSQLVKCVLQRLHTVLGSEGQTLDVDIT